MADWRRCVWVDAATESTIALVQRCAPAPQALAGLGTAEERGPLSFAQALDLQASFYDDGTFDERAVVQVDQLSGHGGPWIATVEPNGYRAELGLLDLARDAQAVALFWNVNAVMSLQRAEAGEIVCAFDPLLGEPAIPDEGADLPFHDHPRAAALALIERWTGAVISEAWFVGVKPTFVITLGQRT